MKPRPRPDRRRQRSRASSAPNRMETSPSPTSAPTSTTSASTTTPTRWYICIINWPAIMSKSVMIPVSGLSRLARAVQSSTPTGWCAPTQTRSRAPRQPLRNQRPRPRRPRPIRLQPQRNPARSSAQTRTACTGTPKTAPATTTASAASPTFSNAPTDCGSMKRSARATSPTKSTARYKHQPNPRENKKTNQPIN